MTTDAKFRSEAGVSLVELLVVCVIIGIVASLAILRPGSANEKLRRQTVSGQLKSAFERARFDSVKRRAVNEDQKAKVVVAGNRFTLFTDVNMNGVITDTVDSVLTTLPAGITIQRYDGAAFGPSNETVAFNMRGEVPLSPAPQFIVCNGTCPAIEFLTPAVADILLVTPTGTVSLLPGEPGAIVPFTNPALNGSTSVTDDINPDVTVPF
jgi:prepilin-type N-terminal cleavage/methylation domain-containing protein